MRSVLWLHRVTSTLRSRPLLALLLVACRDAPNAPVDVVLPPVPVRAIATQLPTLAINTTNAVAIASKDVYVGGSFALSDSTGTTLHTGKLEIRGRGNTTWTMPKKPYRLRLESSASLLSMPANRHWVLLANFSDKTLVRNDVAFELSRMLGMEYSPRSRFVDLEVNGDYQGVYQLTEHVRIAPDRVSIPELKVTDTSATAITGGYLIEVDERRGEDFCFNSTRTRMVFCLSNPETLRDPAWVRHRLYIEGYIARTDSAIFGAQFADPARGYAAYIDVESAIGYYLVNELLKNVDGNLRLSTYLHKKRGGKLTFGPVWDFDLAIGNVNYDNADKVEGWHIRTAAWFTRLFQDPAFAARVKARWTLLKTDGSLDRLVEHISARQAYLSKVQERNFQKWAILGTWVWPNRVVTGSYRGEFQAMQDWLWLRRLWMDAQFSL